MKYRNLLILLIFLSACNKSKQKKPDVKLQDSIKNKIVVHDSILDNKRVVDSFTKPKHELPHLYDDPKLEKEKVLTFGERDGFYVEYSKNELNKIEKLFPVFKTENTSSPAISYEKCSFKKYINQEGKEKIIDFDTPLGADEFYLLYTFYLKQKNGDEKFKKERDKLVELYEKINWVSTSWSASTQYLFHQYRRLHGCVEYSIYLLRVNKISNNEYNFQEQKKLFIKSLTQNVVRRRDEYLKEYPDYYDKQSIKKQTKKILDEIKILEKLITNSFYLEQTINFEREYYNY